MAELFTDLHSNYAGVSGDVHTMALRERALRYAAVAALLRPVSNARGTALQVTSKPCTMHQAGCPFPETLPAAPPSLVAPEDGPDSQSLAHEFEHLFGSVHAPGRLPVVSPCAVTYMGEDTAATADRLRARYKRFGFAMSDDDVSPDCMCHIANELDYVAHCLALASMGVPEAADEARSFIEQELRPWAPLFAAAVCGCAKHPALRYTARVLDQLLACESLSFLRDELPEMEADLRSAVSLE